MRFRWQSWAPTNCCSSATAGSLASAVRLASTAKPVLARDSQNSFATAWLRSDLEYPGPRADGRCREPGPSAAGFGSTPADCGVVRQHPCTAAAGGLPAAASSGSKALGSRRLPGHRPILFPLSRPSGPLLELTGNQRGTGQAPLVGSRLVPGWFLQRPGGTQSHSVGLEVRKSLAHKVLATGFRTVKHASALRGCYAGCPGVPAAVLAGAAR